MYQILIVDDEPVIVKGLVQLFRECDDLEVEIKAAYSASGALTILTSTKIDVVLTDIRMPGMDGIEMHQKISKQWPRCKVIFLTGYNDFNYVQSAIRHGGFDYILKTDRDETIIQAVKNALAALSEEFKEEELIEHAKKQMRLAMPMLQKEYVLSLLYGEKVISEHSQQRFDEIGLALKVNEPLLLVTGYVDFWKKEMGASDKALMLYALQNIAMEYLTVSTNMAAIVYDQFNFVWLLQPGVAEAGNGDDNPSELWNGVVQFVHGTLDSIQTTCKELLHISISLAASSKPFSWNSLSEKYDELRRLLIREHGKSQEMLLTDQLSEKSNRRDDDAEPTLEQQIRAKIKKIKKLEVYLENGQKENFFGLFDEFIDIVSLSANINFKLEMYYAIANLFLSYLNRWELIDEISKQMDMDKLLRFDHHGSWQAAMQYLEHMGRNILEYEKNEQEERAHEVITRIHQYVAEHLSGDLSLTTLAGVVYLNPSYLSRLYKQITGVGISEYITETKLAKAKELLKLPHMKIQDIAGQIGFDSASYFARFFKKLTAMTPQEFRDSL